MLDRDLIRRDPDFVRAGIARKHMDASIVDEFLTVDQAWRTATTHLDEKKAESNRISKSIGQLIGQGKKDEAEAAKAQTADLKKAIAELEAQERNLETDLKSIELQFPNLPHASTPDGETENENVFVREWGAKPEFADAPKPHWEIAENLQLLDLPRGAKITGSGFAVYTGQGARLQRALFNFMVDHQTLRNGYREIYPPFIVNRASLIGTGNLPKFEEDLYKVDDDLYLIPTAEVPVTNLYRDEILDAADLTVNLAAFSGCFRKEAGAAGKDTRGLLRIHQFDKVELVKFTKPEDSYAELELLVKDAESVLQSLGLHYRIVELCTGDIGAKGSKCYDLEVWSPGVDRYLEISSCTNFEAYQARRANIRFRREQGAKPEHVHILNGSGLACPRLFSAIVESFQQPDGTVLLPEVLRSYVGTDRLGA
ncbi:MAG: serine--tRNA ligase [Armatimonadetes bacterium 55-13]|nr:serine--tRNA ligase [Armatimonadota bacterium]OJU62932.1 MAG: serine--tRNA ligase [Armatimonadetes bacterium 55-13]